VRFSTNGIAMQSKVHDLYEASKDGQHMTCCTFNGAEVRVVTAYDDTHNDFPFHVFVREEGKPIHSLTEVPTTMRHATKEGAISQGLEMAMAYLS